MTVRVTFRADVVVYVFTTQDARSFGYSKTDIDRKVAGNAWIRLAQGSYATSAFNGLYPEERHAVRVLGALTTSKNEWHASSWSALAALNLPLVDHDLSRIHLTRHSVTPANRVHGRYIKVDRQLLREDQASANGIPIVSVDLALIEFARQSSFLASTTAIDAALNRKLTSKDALRARLAGTSGKGVSRAAAALDFSDGRAESPGETRLRVLLFRHGFSTPIPQFEIRDGDSDGGPLIYIADLYLPEENLVLEFDGKGKFAAGRMANSEWTQFDHQRSRDQGLTARGYRVMHVTSRDFLDEKLLVARILERIRSKV